MNYLYLHGGSERWGKHRTKGFFQHAIFLEGKWGDETKHSRDRIGIKWGIHGISHQDNQEDIGNIKLKIMIEHWIQRYRIFRQTHICHSVKTWIFPPILDGKTPSIFKGIYVPIMVGMDSHDGMDDHHPHNPYTIYTYIYTMFWPFLAYLVGMTIHKSQLFWRGWLHGFMADQLGPGWPTGANDL